MSEEIVAPYIFKVHPLAKLFPELAGDEFKKLKLDIQAHGLQEPITISAADHDLLLDGRNRLRVCKELQIVPRLVYFQATPTMTEADFIWSKNFRRRHLTDDQKITIAAQWPDALREAAKQRQKVHGGTAPGKPKNTLGESTQSVPRSRDAIAAKLNVSAHKVKQHAAVKKHKPELLPKIVSGEVSLKEAAKQAMPAAIIPKKSEAEFTLHDLCQIEEAARAFSMEDITGNEAAKKFNVPLWAIMKRIHKNGFEWLQDLRQQRGAMRSKIDPLKALISDEGTEMPRPDAPRAVVDPLKTVSVILEESPRQTLRPLVHVEPAPEPKPEPPKSQKDEEFREEIYERPEDQEPERSKPQYKLVLTVDGSRLDVMKKKAQEVFGKDLESIEKINHGASRQDQLEDALEQIEDAKADIQSLRDEMQDIIDNTPDNLRGSQKYSEREECVEALDSLIGDLENIDGSSIEFPGMY